MQNKKRIMRKKKEEALALLLEAGKLSEYPIVELIEEDQDILF